MIKNILDTIENQLSPSAHRKALHSVHSVDSTKRILRRERIRSDRSGQEFCFVQFKLADNSQHQRSLQKLACIIAKRVRLTDEVGWYKENSVGAVLPDTGVEGAQKFTTDVYAAAKQHNLAIIHIIYLYPTPNEKSSTEIKTAKLPYRKSDVGVSQMLSIGVQDLQQVPGPEAIPYQSMNNLLSNPLPSWKRLIDLMGASIGLCMVAPILLIAALAVRMTDKGPVFFVQKRAGLGGKIFYMYKLRTMYVDAEKRKAQLMHLNQQDGPAFKILNDPRITKVGKILRKTSIDELPQLLNVLKGDMSLVGPRPLPVSEQGACENWQQQRLDVTPGLTCIWQVSGRSKLVTFEEWVRMDVQYIYQRSLTSDVRLILGTIPAILGRGGH